VTGGRAVALAGALALAAAVVPAQARPSQAAGLASATVIRPLRVTATADMDFGTITHLPGTSGTVTVSPGVAGAVYAGGAGAACTGADCGSAHAAGFAVTGEPQRNYTVQLPASVIANGAASDPGQTAPSLVVGNLTLRTASSGVPRLDGSGADSFEVGGTITLPADLPPARYRASFSVIVTYI
jgi:hypothetical protein